MNALNVLLLFLLVCLVKKMPKVNDNMMEQEINFLVFPLYQSHYPTDEIIYELKFIKGYNWFKLQLYNIWDFI